MLLADPVAELFSISERFTDEVLNIKLIVVVLHYLVLPIKKNAILKPIQCSHTMCNMVVTHMINMN